MADDHSHEHFHERFQSATHYTDELDSPERAEWQMPDRAIEALDIAPDAQVAELGAGTGYFMLRIAKKLTHGHIIGVDVEPEMTKRIDAYLSAHQITTASTQVITAGEYPNVELPIDRLFCVNVYHHLPNRSEYFSGYSNILAKDGTISVIDFKIDSEKGPPPEHRTSREDVLAEMTAAGYTLRAEHTFLPYQYFLTFSL